MRRAIRPAMSRTPIFSPGGSTDSRPMQDIFVELRRVGIHRVEILAGRVFEKGDAAR